MMRRALTILAATLLMAGMMPTGALADSPGVTSQDVTALANRIGSLESQLATEVTVVQQDRLALSEAMLGLPVFEEEQIDLAQGQQLMSTVRWALYRTKKDGDLQQDANSATTPIATLRADVLQLTLDLAVLKTADRSIVTLTDQVNGLAVASAPSDDSGADGTPSTNGTVGGAAGQ